MSGACNNFLLLSSPSPTSKQQQQLGSDCSDLLNKFIHVDSPRSSPSLFKRPAPVSSTSKWKAVLAHLSPPRLLPVPAALRSNRPRRPLNRPERPLAAAATTIAIPDIQSAAVSADFQSATDNFQSAPAANDIQIPTDDPAITAHNQPAVPADRASLFAACDPSLSTKQLLHILAESLHIHDATHTRLHALASLCSLCIASLSAVDLCLAENGIDIILEILNLPSATDMQVVEESEKALLLLQLLASSADGCGAVLGRSSLAIATLGKKLLRVSEACTASAIAILTMLCKDPEATPSFRKALSQTAIPSKLVLVLQVASKDSTKRRAGRLLRLIGEPEH